VVLVVEVPVLEHPLVRLEQEREMLVDIHQPKDFQVVPAQEILALVRPVAVVVEVVALVLLVHLKTQAMVAWVYSPLFLVQM
jgi:hypothetical protein